MVIPTMIAGVTPNRKPSTMRRSDIPMLGQSTPLVLKVNSACKQFEGAGKNVGSISFVRLAISHRISKTTTGIRLPTGEEMIRNGRDGGRNFFPPLRYSTTLTPAAASSVAGVAFVPDTLGSWSALMSVPSLQPVRWPSFRLVIDSTGVPSARRNGDPARSRYRAAGRTGQ